DCRGFVHDQQGAWPQDFGAARRVAEAAGDQFRVYIVNLQESWTHSKAGNPAAGRALVEQGLRFAEKIGTVFYLALGKAWLAACAVALGDGTAPALCRAALLEAEKTSDRLAQAVAYVPSRRHWRRTGPRPIAPGPRRPWPKPSGCTRRSNSTQSS